MLELIKKNSWIILSWMILLVMSSYLKIGILVGSNEASLSLMAAAMPIIAYFFRSSIALPFVGSAWILSHLAWPIPITLGIPTLLATISWRMSDPKNSLRDRVFHFGIPALCMFLFFVSPVGATAWLYSLYWLIPMILSIVNLGLIGRALKSTFIAHAVGSVIWVYLIPMSPEAWLGLIPVVALERFFTASWSVAMIGILLYATPERWRLAPKSSFLSPAGVLQRYATKA